MYFYTILFAMLKPKSSLKHKINISTMYVQFENHSVFQALILDSAAYKKSKTRSRSLSHLGLKPKCQWLWHFYVGMTFWWRLWNMAIASSQLEINLYSRSTYSRLRTPITRYTKYKLIRLVHYGFKRLKYIIQNKFIILYFAGGRVK